MESRHAAAPAEADRGCRGLEATGAVLDHPARHQGHRHPLKGESYFFFLATLRVFFAVFFTALFAFFAFFAFLAMLPSDV